MLDEISSTEHLMNIKRTKSHGTMEAHILSTIIWVEFDTATKKNENHQKLLSKLLPTMVPSSLPSSFHPPRQQPTPPAAVTTVCIVDKPDINIFYFFATHFPKY